MAKAIGRAVERSVRVVPTPAWLFMKAARMGSYPIELLSNVRYYIDDHKRGAFELGAPTTDVLDVTGRPAEDYETIARHYALPHNQRTLGKRFREFAQFLMAPLDQFHTRGILATAELAGAAGLGCGIGGPARYLAATFGCRMTGVDLSPDFIDAATCLTARCGLSDRVTFHVGDALHLPFEDAVFDSVPAACGDEHRGPHRPRMPNCL
jgi:hypothetical protein